MENASPYNITIDDDPLVHKLIEAMLGVKSLSFSSGETFLRRGARYNPEAIFVDVNLGLNDNGLHLIPEIRSQWEYCPIFVVTSQIDEKLISSALASGAHDFLKKPLNPDELRARYTTRRLEQNERAGKSKVQVGDICLDINLRTLVGPKMTRFLSPLEARLLAAIIEAKGGIVMKNDLKRRIWGVVKVSNTTFDKKIFDLRAILADVSIEVGIETAYGKGVRLTTEKLGEKIAS